MDRRKIAVSMGDPFGIGPEICLKAAADRRVRRCCTPVIFGDAAILARLSAKLDIPLPDAVVDCSGEYGRLPAAAHKSSAAGGNASFSYIKNALNAVEHREASAIVTGPISKESLHLAGIDYPGHTEMLADLTGCRFPCMMMASSRINVSLVTTHTGYRQAASEITRAKILKVIELTGRALENMLSRKPRLTVCALNPHAGENGLFGDEEKRIICPALKTAASRGYRVSGPLPADTAFIPKVRKITDAYIVMYHDQGLIPFKMLSFYDGVNVTLGLPVIRTSVDHGTAFDIAWRGEASHESLVQAILTALRLR